MTAGSKILYSGVLLLGGLSAGYAADWSGNLALELRHFSVSDAQRQSTNYSMSAEPELYYQLGDSRDSIIFTPFVRLDEHDDERSHADIRELYWHKVERDWELIAGINKVFWGKTETVHLVDIINQTDLVENIDGEDKLGQPMIQLTWIPDWGFVDFFVLPGFRERTFPGVDGRPQLTPLPVDTGNTLYESADKDRHVDYAVRWSNTLGALDIGLSHFTGTSREPLFVPSLNGDGQSVLSPYYELINQTGIDAQITLDAWLLKLEAINVDTRGEGGERLNAAAAGFEYTFVGVFGGNADIGLLGEYLYDERDHRVFDNDLAVGVRIVLNDVQSTEILLAGITDIDNRSLGYFVEASRRIGDAYTLNLEYRGAANVEAGDPAEALRRERFLQLELAYYF